MTKAIRITALIICMAALIGLLGCGAAPANTAPPSPETAGAEGKTVAEKMATGGYAYIVDKMQPELKKTLKTNVLEAAWQAEAAGLGAYVETGESTTSESDGLAVVQTTVKLEKGEMLVTTSFDGDMKIAGLYIKRTSGAAAGAIELELPEGAREISITLFAGTEKELKGMVILPAVWGENAPAVVFAQGSGSTDMNETIGPNMPFRDIAYGLAAQGIASVRYDKMSFSHPELFADRTFTVDLEYLEAALEALRVIREQGAGQVYMLGHSLGGMLTPYIMQQSQGGFAGGIIMAGSPRKLTDIAYDQNMEMVNLMGTVEQVLNKVAVDSEKSKVDKIDSLSEEDLLKVTLFGMPGPYIKHLNGIDAAAVAVENGLPLLLLQGDEDFQVRKTRDFEPWQAALSELGDKAQYKTYPGLSHLFLAAHGGISVGLEAYATPDTVDQTVIDDIARWILGDK